MSDLKNEFHGLSLLHKIGIRLVPEQPTQAMCRAGCSIGDVDGDTVRRIYNAMVQAAGDSTLHGDCTLN